jgi:hypothetical protein
MSPHVLYMRYSLDRGCRVIHIIAQQVCYVGTKNIAICSNYNALTLFKLTNEGFDEQRTKIRFFTNREQKLGFSRTRSQT